LNINYIRRSLKYLYNASSVKSRIFKNQLSFFYKNDLKRIYLRRPGLMKVLLYFSRKRKKSPKRFKLPLLSHSYSLQNLHSPTYSNTFLVNRFFNSSLAKYRSNNSFLNYRGTVPTRRYSSFKKIRFKPGYQRIWRRARSSLNFNLNLNFRYQAKLTKKITALRRLKTTFSIRQVELSLYRTLLNVRFVFDEKTSLDIINEGLIFVNGLAASNPFMQIFFNDFVQLLVSIKYYISYRWINGWRKFNRTKFIKLLNHKRNSSRYDLSKQVSHHLPDWVFNYSFKNLDIPKYFEVDMFTLSFFIVFKPTRVTHFNPLSLIESRHNIYTMYNWKYIT
jgi:hypothetical protein